MRGGEGEGGRFLKSGAKLGSNWGSILSEHLYFEHAMVAPAPHGEGGQMRVRSFPLFIPILFYTYS